MRGYAALQLQSEHMEKIMVCFLRAQKYSYLMELINTSGHASVARHT